MSAMLPPVNPIVNPLVNLPTKQNSPQRKVKKGYAESETASFVPNALRNVEKESKRIQDLLEAAKKDPRYYVVLKTRHLELVEPILIDLSSRATSQMMHQLSEDLQDHAERKLQLFFSQMLLVVKTNKTYALHHTKDQSGQGKKYFPAAHSGVIPSLKVIEGNRCLDFASGTTFGDIFNITIILPKESNDVDLAIEGKNGVNNRLRYQGLSLLNELAAGTKTDLKAVFREFLSLYYEGIERSRKYYSKNSKTSQLFTLQCYHWVVYRYDEQLQAGDDLLKKMCFIGKESLNSPLSVCVDSATAQMQADLKETQTQIPDQQRILATTAVEPRVTRAAVKASALIQTQRVAQEQEVKRNSARLVYTTPVKIDRSPLATLGVQGTKYKRLLNNSPEMQKLVNSHLSKKIGSPTKTQLVVKAKALIRVANKMKGHPQHVSLIVDHLLRDRKNSAA